MATYSTERFNDAHARLLENPASLSDDDLALFDLVAPALGDRARAKRAGYVEAVDPQFAALERQPVSHRQLRGYADDVLFPIMATHVFKIRQLEQRLNELEQRPASSTGCEYAGTYSPTTQYTAGQLITRGGGLWLCLRESLAQTPGTSPNWRLVVKSGGA